VAKATTGAAMAPAAKPLQRLPRGHPCSGPPSTTPGPALFKCASSMRWLPSSRHSRLPGAAAGSPPGSAPVVWTPGAPVLLRRPPSTSAGAAPWFPATSRRHPLVLGLAIPRFDLQHHDSPAASSDRLVFRLRCYLPHDLEPFNPFTHFIPAVPFSFINCCR